MSLLRINQSLNDDVNYYNQNMLYFAKWLLNRGYSYYLDINGFGNFSSIVSRKDHSKTYNLDYRNQVIAILQNSGFIFKKLERQTKVIVIGLQSK
jgi:hypothetical protein